MNRVTTSGDTMKRNLNVIAITKNGETFLFTFDDDAESRHRLQSELGKMAGDPQLNFSWYDAAKISRQVRCGEFVRF